MQLAHEPAATAEVEVVVAIAIDIAPRHARPEPRELVRQQRLELEIVEGPARGAPLGERSCPRKDRSWPVGAPPCLAGLGDGVALPAGRFFSSWRMPLGQSITSRSIFFAPPTPKCATGSSPDLNPDSDRSQRCCTRSPACASSRAPSPKRLLCSPRSGNRHSLASAEVVAVERDRFVHVDDRQIRIAIAVEVGARCGKADALVIEPPGLRDVLEAEVALVSKREVLFLARRRILVGIPLALADEHAP